jgi:hypothetical protein
MYEGIFDRRVLSGMGLYPSPAHALSLSGAITEICMLFVALSAYKIRNP